MDACRRPFGLLEALSCSKKAPNPQPETQLIAAAGRESLDPGSSEARHSRVEKEDALLEVRVQGLGFRV